MATGLANTPLKGGKTSSSWEIAADPGLIQSPPQALLPVLPAWAEVGGMAPSLCLKAPPLQTIST
jgi:hypothetical protein